MKNIRTGRDSNPLPLSLEPQMELSEPAYNTVDVQVYVPIENIHIPSPL